LRFQIWSELKVGISTELDIELTGFFRKQDFFPVYAKTVLSV